MYPPRHPAAVKRECRGVQDTRLARAVHLQHFSREFWIHPGIRGDALTKGTHSGVRKRVFETSGRFQKYLPFEDGTPTELSAEVKHESTCLSVRHSWRGLCWVIHGWMYIHMCIEVPVSCGEIPPLILVVCFETHTRLTVRPFHVDRERRLCTTLHARTSVRASGLSTSLPVDENRGTFTIAFEAWKLSDVVSGAV